MIPSVESLAKFGLRSANKWLVSLSNWDNIQSGKTVIAPVTSVTYLQPSPLTTTEEIGPGVEVVMQYGVSPTKEVNITMLENHALTVQNFLLNYALGGNKWDGESARPYNLVQYEGIPIVELYKNNTIKMTITQYGVSSSVSNSKEDKALARVLNVIPKDGLSVSLDQGAEALSYNLSFYVLGDNKFK